MIHTEVVWWIETNIQRFRQSQRLVLPQLDSINRSSPLAWKLYWIELKERVLPPLLKHQASILTLQILQGSLSTFGASKDVILRCNQHPPQRAIAIASRESDRLLVGVEVTVASLWANALYFASQYIVAQLGAMYKAYRIRRVGQSRDSFLSDEEHLEVFVEKSWGLLTTNSRRYFYSAIGAGLGSIVWPGWGTLFCTGLGEVWAGMRPHPELPDYLMQLLHSSLGGMSSGISSLFRAHWLDSLLWRKRLRKDSMNKGDSFEDLVCGCCQTTTFSSNPNSRSAPISSRSCSHTICKACVVQCHLALMEQTTNHEEWIACPLCKANKAFSSQNHLVNRSLCSAIAAMERNQQNSSTSEQAAKQVQ